MLVTVSSPWEVRKLLAKGRKVVDYDFPVKSSEPRRNSSREINATQKACALIACGASKLDIRIKNQQLYFKGQKVKDLILTSEEEDVLKLSRNQN